MPQEGALLCGRYRLEKLIGRGGMADVYLAFDEERQAPVAIKVLRDHLAAEPDLARRFRGEAEALAALDHPNIVRLYGFEEADGQIFIVMNYVPGTTLGDLLAARRGPLDLSEASRIFRDLCGALYYAHKKGIVHQDLKPGNVILTADGHTMLTDFGIAHALDSAGITDVAMGTPAYMSPEQIRGESVGIASDIYSLGILLYEMVTGRRPFTGSEPGLTEADTAGRLQEAHLWLAAPDPRKYSPKLPPKVGEVLARALAKQPDDRWPDVLAFRDAWDAAVKGQKNSTPKRLGTGQTPSKTTNTSVPSRTFLIWVLALGTIIALAGAGYVIGDLLWDKTLIHSQPPGQATAGTDMEPSPTATPRVHSTPSLPKKTSQGGGVVVAGGGEMTASPTTTSGIEESAARGLVIVASKIPSASPTLIPTATAEPSATPVPSPTSVPSPTATATRPATPTATRPSRTGGVDLLAPAANETLQGVVWFSWRDKSGFSLGPGEQYELVFWVAGQDGFRDGRSPVGASTQTQVAVNMAIVPQLFGSSGGQFMWGIRLWGPAGPVRMLSEGRPFAVASAGEGAPPPPPPEW